MVNEYAVSCTRGRHEPVGLPSPFWGVSIRDNHAQFARSRLHLLPPGQFVLISNSDATRRARLVGLTLCSIPGRLDATRSANPRPGPARAQIARAPSTKRVLGRRTRAAAAAATRKRGCSELERKHKTRSRRRCRAGRGADHPHVRGSRRCLKQLRLTVTVAPFQTVNRYCFTV